MSCERSIAESRQSIVRASNCCTRVFEAQARKNPNALAIAAAERRLTYGELDSMSALTAGALIGGGLKPGGLVAVMLKKGWEQIVACLAVLKAGGTYVPVDPALPTARLKVILGQGKFHGAIVADATPRGNSWASCLRSMRSEERRVGKECRSRW